MIIQHIKLLQMLGVCGHRPGRLVCFFILYAILDILTVSALSRYSVNLGDSSFWANLQPWQVTGILSRETEAEAHL